MNKSTNKILTAEIKKNLYKKKWKHNFTTNCYAYALGLDIKEKNIMPSAYGVGTMSGKNINPIFTYKKFIKCLYSDFESIGILYRKVKHNEIIYADEWKIALFLLPLLYEKNIGQMYYYNFHFLREINENVWMHKLGWFKKPSEKDENKKIITNPKDCNILGYKYIESYALKLKKTN